MAGTRRRGHSVEATAGLTGPVGGGWEGRGYGWDAQDVDGFGSGGTSWWCRGRFGVTRPGRGGIGWSGRTVRRRDA